jgi:CxxC-x17-CxxC domain-containing protein
MSFHNKGGFGGGRDKKQPQRYSATCAECHKQCEVPFRPTEARPVYCKECFNKKRGNTGNQSNQRNVAPHGSVPTQHDDRNTYSLRKHLDSIHNKLDVIVKMIEDMPSQKKATKKVKEDTSAKPAKKIKKATKKK